MKLIRVSSKEGAIVRDEFGRLIPSDTWANVRPTKKIRKAIADGKLELVKRSKRSKKPSETITENKNTENKDTDNGSN